MLCFWVKMRVINIKLTVVIVGIRGGYRMAIIGYDSGWRYTKLSRSSAFVYLFLTCALCYCSFLFAVIVFVFMLSLELLIGR